MVGAVGDVYAAIRNRGPGGATMSMGHRVVTGVAGVLTLLPLVGAIGREAGAAIRGGAAMAEGGSSLIGYHGAEAERLVGIIRNRGFIPQNGRVFLSEVIEDVYSHGADIARRAAFVAEFEVSTSGASVIRTATAGVPRTLILESAELIPATVRRLYVRTLLPGGGANYDVIEGVDEILAHLTQ